MDPSGSQGETGSELKLQLRKCVLCEKLVSSAEEAFLGHISEEHNLRSRKEYEAYYETYYTLNGKKGESPTQASVKQEGIVEKSKAADKSEVGAVEPEKVDSGMEEGDSDQELVSLLTKQPGLVDCSDTSADFTGDVGVNESSKEIMSSISDDNQSKVKLEKKFEGMRNVGDKSSPKTPGVKGRPRGNDSKWSLRCKYRCKLCDIEKDDWTGMSRHLKKMHADADFKGPEEFLTHEERHGCRICQKILRHDNYFIRSHLSSAHNLTLSTYYLRYIMLEEGESESGTGKMENNQAKRGNFAKKEELADDDDDDDITERMLLADKDMEMMTNTTPKTTKKKKRGRPPKNRMQIDSQKQNILPKKQCSFERPQQSYKELIAEALMQAENRMLTASDILIYISQKYPYFKMKVSRDKKSWKDFVRTCLSLTPYFEKLPNPKGKGNFWRMNLHLKKNNKKKRGRPIKASKVDRMKTMMAKKALRVELEDIGTTIVPKLISVQNGDDDCESSSTSPMKQVSGEPPIRMESAELDNDVRNCKRKQDNLDQEERGNSVNEEELEDDDDITERMLLADKDMEMLKNETVSKTKKKRGRPPKNRMQTDSPDQKMVTKKHEIYLTKAKKEVFPELTACEFSCTLCPKKFDRWLAMRIHLTKEHRERYGNRKWCKPLDFVTQRSYHSCKVCKESILQDRTLIYNHIQKHGMKSLAHYVDLEPNQIDDRREDSSDVGQDGKDSLEMEANIDESKQTDESEEQEETHLQPSLLKQTVEGSKGMVDSPKSSAPQKVIQYKALGCLLLGPRNMFDCNVCGRLIPDCSLAEANRHCNSEHGINLVQYYKMASGKITEHWSEACVYKCQICWSFDTTSKTLFVKHLNGSHAKSQAEYQEAYLNLIFISSVLECKRCGKNILHTRESIESHLKETDCLRRAVKGTHRQMDGSHVDLLRMYRLDWGME